MLLPGVLLFCIATILAAYFAGMELLLINFYGSLLCLLVILALDLMLIPSRGMKGAAMASSIGYGITCFYFIIVYCYREKISPVKFFIPQRSDLGYIRSILQAISSKK